MENRHATALHRQTNKQTERQTEGQFSDHPYRTARFARGQKAKPVSVEDPNVVSATSQELDIRSLVVIADPSCDPRTLRLQIVVWIQC